MAEKYAITNTVVSPAQRNRFRALRHAGTYRNMKPTSPEVGDRGVYTVELTPQEVRDLQRDRPSNLVRLEKVPPGGAPAVDARIPSDADLRDHKADMLYEWGFTGRGIDVGVIDSAMSQTVAARFDIKAIRGEDGANPYALDDTSTPDHGSRVASIAVPRRAQLVFSRAVDFGNQFDASDEVSALYWMVDEVGVHIVNMSFASPSSWQTGADAMAYAKSKGVILVAAAGNYSSSTPHYPAAYDGVLAVGSLDKTRGWARADHSNYGSWVDMWANGVSVQMYASDGSVTTGNGTSYASPLTTYVKAALLTKGLSSLGQIKTEQAVREGADGAPTGAGGGGRLNGEGGAWKMRDLC